MGFGLGGNQNGFTIELSASGQHSTENGATLTHQNSHVTASNSLTLTSGGGNLTVSSVQDTATYNSKSTSAGINISICVPPICLGQAVAGNANLSQQILNNHYALVAEQSGIKAGSGGYHIIVKDHTQLDGGVIASTAPADKNQLQTGILGWRDIANVSDYQGSGYAVGVSTSSIPTGIRRPPTAVSRTVLTRIRSPTGWRSSAQAMGMLQQKLQSDAQTRIITKYAALGYTPEQITRAIANDPAYQAIVKDYSIGGKYWTMSASFTSALAGLMGGNVQGAAVGAVAPYLANLVKQISAEDEPLRVVLHTALGAFLAAAQGGNATAGAAGALASAASASTAEKLARLIFNSGPNDTLTEDQKQVIDNLVVIAGSVAGGVVGGGLSGVGSGANTAKNEVENNSLSDIAQAQSEGKALEQKAGEYVEAENERYRKANCGGMSAEACSVKMYTERREALKETALTGADFVPVVGDIKSFAEAQSALDYVAAAIGLIPGVGDAAGKAIKTAETALKKGGCG